MLSVGFMGFSQIFFGLEFMDFSSSWYFLFWTKYSSRKQFVEYVQHYFQHKKYKSQAKPEIKFKLNSLENDEKMARSEICKQKFHSVQKIHKFLSKDIQNQFSILLVARNPPSLILLGFTIFLGVCRRNACRYDLFLYVRKAKIPTNGKKIMIDITFLCLWINIFVIWVF